MKYEKPEVNMFKFDVEDVITTSAPFTTTPAAPSVTTTTKPFVTDYEEL